MKKLIFMRPNTTAKKLGSNVKPSNLTNGPSKKVVKRNKSTK